MIDFYFFIEIRTQMDVSTTIKAEQSYRPYIKCIVNLLFIAFGVCANGFVALSFPCMEDVVCPPSSHL
jgi:hypothetical protein